MNYLAKIALPKFRTSFDHDKGQKICNFGAAVSTGGSPLDFLLFSPGIYVRFSKTSPPKIWRKVAKNPVEKIASNPVTSVAVMVFFGPDKSVPN